LLTTTNTSLPVRIFINGTERIIIAYLYKVSRLIVLTLTVSKESPGNTEHRTS
jgi:hypothetical protein